MVDDTFEASVSLLIQDLKQGDNRAAQDLWDRYFPRLVQVARRRLGNASRRVADEEDVVVSAFNSLCAGAHEGRFDQLHDRDDLWKLMIAITGMKSVDQIRRATARKRGGGEVRGNSVVVATDDDAPAGFEQFADTALSPAFLAELDEQQDRLFSQLRDDQHRQIARLRLEGLSNEEVAHRVGISIRSVERKLKLIRQVWSLELEQDMS